MNYSEVFAQSFDPWRSFLIGKEALFIGQDEDESISISRVIKDIRLLGHFVEFVVEGIRIPLDLNRLQIEINYEEKYFKVYNTNLRVFSCVECKFD